MVAINNTSSSEIMDRGINCLIEQLGIIETEQFISVLLREKSDYTKWRQQYFADVNSDEFYTSALEYGKAANSLTEPLS